MDLLIFLLAFLSGALVVAIAFTFLLFARVIRMLSSDTTTDTPLPFNIPMPSLGGSQRDDVKDQYTPDYADTEQPLDTFTPDFSKPISLKFKDDDEGTGIEEIEEPSR